MTIAIDHDHGGALENGEIRYAAREWFRADHYSEAPGEDVKQIQIHLTHKISDKSCDDARVWIFGGWHDLDFSVDYFFAVAVGAGVFAIIMTALSTTA